MTEPGPAGGADVWLHPRRSPGAFYLGAAAVLLLIVVVAAWTYVSTGRFVMAAVGGIVGLGLVGFLVLLAIGILVPGLVLDGEGVRGRTGLGAPVDLSWDRIGIDTAENALTGTFRFDFEGDDLAVNPRAWVGYREAMLLVASTAVASDQLTPAARAELARLLGIGTPDLP